MANSVKPTRIEKDSLGEVPVPKSALYGAQTQRAINNFSISGLMMPRSFIYALGVLKSACSKANHELELLPRDISLAIQHAADAVAKGDYDDHFPVDVFQTGSGTSTNMNANEVIANLASQAIDKKIHANDLVNMGQSSNDVIPTCIHISAVSQISEHLLPALSQLTKSIQQKSTSLKAVVKTGRTHLMDAMPITMEQEMSGWSAQLEQGYTRISESLVRLQELAIGGTAVGTGVNTHRDFSSKVISALNQTTGKKFVNKKNYFEALSCQDSAVEMSGQLKTLAVSLMKITNDLRWMNSGPQAGLAEINLPSLQPGSSIMPGKVNPVIPEATMMACAQVMGNDTTITIAGQSGNFQLNVMLPVIAYNLLQSIDLLTNSMIQLAQTTIVNFTVNKKHIAETLEQNPVLITALNNLIGYDKAADIAKKALEQRRPILDVAREMTELSNDELVELLNPRKLANQK